TASAIGPAYAAPNAARPIAASHSRIARERSASRLNSSGRSSATAPPTNPVPCPSPRSTCADLQRRPFHTASDTFNGPLGLLTSSRERCNRSGDGRGRRDRRRAEFLARCEAFVGATRLIGLPCAQSVPPCTEPGTRV